MPSIRARASFTAAILVLLSAALAGTRPAVSIPDEPGPWPAPIRQSALPPTTAPVPLTIEDVSQPDRWFGVGVRDVRWAPDGSSVYFRWHPRPQPGDDADADPWLKVDLQGRVVQRVPDAEVHVIPGDDLVWSRDGRAAAWTRGSALYVVRADQPGQPARVVFSGSTPARRPRFTYDGAALQFLLGSDLYRHVLASGDTQRLTAIVERAKSSTEEQTWLKAQQHELFDTLRHDQKVKDARERRAVEIDPLTPTTLTLDPSTRIEDAQLSPDGRFVVFRAVTRSADRPATKYLDFVTESGYSEVREARGKVGEPRDVNRLGIARAGGGEREAKDLTWVVLSDAHDRATIVHGPSWSLEGDRAVVQVVSADQKDLWIADLDVETGRTRVIDHQHDDAWLGGPAIQTNSGGPAFLEWLPGGRFVFASERTGWSHLYMAEPDGRIRPLTSGEWELRSAEISRDRRTLLVRASREHPADDHLYLLPASGGELVRLTTKEGRSDGRLSPDGRRVAITYSETIHLPDLFLRDAAAGGDETRVTVSGSDEYYRHAWVRPEMTTLKHPDGGPLYAALFRSPAPHPLHPAVLYIHGGGYRQFAQRGWSVYGYSYASHVSMINYLLQQGYTVLDLDYRGSAGYGRNYRTDIYRAMGGKDVDGAVAAASYLVERHGIDRQRIGLYGVSYGGFVTLMSLFKHPGVFAAGVSAAGVTDWAHYSDDWTSRILNLPYDDPEAYKQSSPIYHAEGLRDALLIEHGLLDDNVHFQDAARLVQRLVELKKDFEVIYYPLEPHVIHGPASLLDFHKRLVAFFERHLKGAGTRD